MADHGGQVAFHGVERQAAQSVISAEFDQYHYRFMAGEGTGQARTGIGGGVTADTVVNDAVGVTLAFQAFLQLIKLRQYFLPARCRWFEHRA